MKIRKEIKIFKTAERLKAALGKKLGIQYAKYL